MSTRRSQMEVMGLVIIVILITLGLFFMLIFAAKSSESTDSFTRDQLASSTASALLKTSTACNGLRTTVLIQDCASFRDYECANAVDSCEFVESLAATLLGQTLKEWQKSYTFRVYVDGSGTDLVKVEHNGCPGTRDTSLNPLPSLIPGSDNIIVRLDVCD